MSKRTISTVLILLVTLVIPSVGFCQNADSIAYVGFKRILPFVIKNLDQNKTTPDNLITKVGDTKHVPLWDIKEFEEEENQKILNTLESNTTYSVQSKSGQKDEINLVCHLQDFDLDPVLKRAFQRYYVELSNFDIKNEKGEAVYLNNIKNKRQPKKDVIKKVTLQGAQFNAQIPISKHYNTLNGSVDFELIAYTDIAYKLLSIEDKGKPFEVNDFSFELVKIELNQAVVQVSQKIDDLQWFSTNELGQMYREGSVTQIPENIYRISLESDLTEADIKLFVDNYTFEDYSNKDQPHILIYKASGAITNLGLFQSGTRTVGKGRLNFKL